jgi:hypothetical protein
MTDQIRALLNQIQVLEGELKDAIHEQEATALYRIEGKRIEFEHLVAEAHRRLKLGVFAWLRASQLRNVLSAPFIYAMIVPLILLDGCLLAYQAVCFRLYRIPAVRRADYIVVDRHQLAYLNVIEKIHCVYCGYANGFLAYATEVVARTEQYWCPIKHARRLAGPHDRYVDFVDYGDADGFHTHSATLRGRLRPDGLSPPPQG